MLYPSLALMELIWSEAITWQSKPLLNFSKILRFSSVLGVMSISSLLERYAGDSGSGLKLVNKG